MAHSGIGDSEGCCINAYETDRISERDKSVVATLIYGM